MEYIEIDKMAIPYKFDITLQDETFTLYVKYNTLYDYFTLDLYKGEEAIVLGEKVVYGRPLFSTSQHKEVPKVRILPLDLTRRNQRVTFDNFGQEAFLFIVGDEDEVLD